MAKDAIIEKLNTALEMEYSAAIAYWTHAAVVGGSTSELFAARMKEIAADEVEHAEKLRERIVARGGRPSTKLSDLRIRTSRAAGPLLKDELAEERRAVGQYAELLELARAEKRRDYRLVHALYEIIEEEQHHIEELSRLLG